MRQVTGWLTRHPTALSEEERAALKHVLARCPELDTAAQQIRDFREILTNRLGPTLPTWSNAVDISQLLGLTEFVLHLLRDHSPRSVPEPSFESTCWFGRVGSAGSDRTVTGVRRSLDLAPE
ncbi:hypothetical protein [Streptomyces sp. NPDC001165]|uniref:hypothetical protein n=1 Tax=Streptomyces sp. NPDC001165 TaxID=3364546 RepID=UPI0036821D7C